LSSLQTQFFSELLVDLQSEMGLELLVETNSMKSKSKTGWFGAFGSLDHLQLFRISSLEFCLHLPVFVPSISRENLATWLNLEVESFTQSTVLRTGHDL
jgi:hypothetical protein